LGWFILSVNSEKEAREVNQWGNEGLQNWPAKQPFKGDFTSLGKLKILPTKKG
jgi:hypothetical protein